MPSPAEQLQQEQQKQDQKAAGEKPESSQPESNEEKTIPYNRFQEVNEGKKALEQKLADYEAAELKRQADSEAAKKKQLEEQNKFQELYQAAEAEKTRAIESATTLTGRVELLEKALETQWDTQKELIPEMFRDLVGAMPIEARIEWLSTNSEKLTEKDKSNGTPRGVQSRRITPPDQSQSKRAPVLPSFKF